jgi:hypothetical protein
VAGRPLRPATHRSLGEPLPHQLANGPRAPPQAPTFMKRSALNAQPEGRAMSSGISPPFGRLFRTQGQVTHVLLTRSPLYRGPCGPFLVRLACVRHAASVRSEPGSNSPSKIKAPKGFGFLDRELTCKRSFLKTQIDRCAIQFSKSSCREARILRRAPRTCQDLDGIFFPLDRNGNLTISFVRGCS